MKNFFMRFGGLLAAAFLIWLTLPGCATSKHIDRENATLHATASTKENTKLETTSAARRDSLASYTAAGKTTERTAQEVVEITTTTTTDPGGPALASDVKLSDLLTGRILRGEDAGQTFVTAYDPISGTVTTTATRKQREVVSRTEKHTTGTADKTTNYRAGGQAQETITEAATAKTKTRKETVRDTASTSASVKKSVVKPPFPWGWIRFGLGAVALAVGLWFFWPVVLPVVLRFGATIFKR